MVPYLLKRRRNFLESRRPETHGLPELPLESSTKILDFGVHALPLTSTPTLSLGPKETESPIAVNLREKVELLPLTFLLQTRNLGSTDSDHPIFVDRRENEEFIFFLSLTQPTARSLQKMRFLPFFFLSL